MPRTMRPHARPTSRVRRRHRTWMRAMTLATVGWGIIWGSLAIAKIGWTPPASWIYAAASIPGILGLIYAILTIRARRTWLFMALVAIFANGSLVALPFLFDAEFRSALSSVSQDAADHTSRSAP